MNRPTDLPGRPIQVRRDRNPLALLDRMKRELPADLTPEQLAAAVRALEKRAGLR